LKEYILWERNKKRLGIVEYVLSAVISLLGQFLIDVLSVVFLWKVILEKLKRVKQKEKRKRKIREKERRKIREKASLNIR